MQRHAEIWPTGKSADKPVDLSNAALHGCTAQNVPSPAAAAAGGAGLTAAAPVANSSAS